MTSERLEHALRLAKRVLTPDPRGPDLEAAEIADLAQNLVLLDGALASGAPFPACWCRAMPTDAETHRRVHSAAGKALSRARAVARRVLDAHRMEVTVHEVVLMARLVVELDFALSSGGEYPPSWMGPPARFADASERGPALVA